MPLLQARNAIYEMRYYILSQLSKRSSVISGFGGIRFPHVRGLDSSSFKDYLIIPRILLDNLGVGPSGFG
jgi:hypothetical protein